MRTLETPDRRSQRVERILHAPVPGLICRFAAPAIVTMLVSALYNFADTYFVSGLNDEATAAVGIVYALVCFAQSVGYFWGQGSANHISRELGSGNAEDAQKMAQAGFLCSVFSGLTVTVLGLLLLTPLCLLLGSPDEILSETRLYCGIILLGIPFLMASLTMNCQYRHQGNAVSSMIGICVGAILNVALDPLLIYRFGWGLAGAAWATVISQAASFWILFYQSRTRGNLPLSFTFLRITKKMIRNMLPGGMPSLWRQSLLSVSMAVLNTVAKPFGVALVAAMSVVSKVMSVCIAIATGFGQGAQPVWGMNYGAGNYRRVMGAYRFTLLVAFGMDACIGGICYAAAPQIIRLFEGAEGSEICKYGITALRAQCITFPVTSFLLITNMMVQTMGKMFSGTLLAVARNGLFFLPIVLIFSRQWGVPGIQWAQPCADICAFICTVFVWLEAWHGLKRPVAAKKT